MIEGVPTHPANPDLLGWLEERREEIVDFLARLVRAESPTTNPAAQARVFEQIAGPLEELGFAVRSLSGRDTGGQLYARPRDRRKGAPAQLVLGHVDTVWSEGTIDEMPIVDDDDKLRGPGVFDMKGGLAQLVFALRALDTLDIEPEVTPVVFLNSDEEIGSPESANRIRHLARRCGRALVLEPALGPEGRIKTSRRGVGRFDIRIVGESAHTGLDPGKGASAIQELSHVIQQLHDLSDIDRGITVNVGQVQGGMRPNVVAPEARAVVDVRVRTTEDGRWLEEQVRGLEPRTPGTRLEVEGGVDRAPMEPTPRNRVLWHAAEAVGASLGLELEEGMSGGASDGNITSQYTATLDGLGAVGDGAHALHEYVEMGRLAERAALLAGILILPELPEREKALRPGRAQPARAKADVGGGARGSGASE